jgi:hypothetical protein
MLHWLSRLSSELPEPSRELSPCTRSNDATALMEHRLPACVLVRPLSTLGSGCSDLLAAWLLDGLAPSGGRQQADQCLTGLVWNQGNFCIRFD